MSYRTVKRVLGESNLARKCRRIFGACMLVLITGSFYAYSVQNEKIVRDQNRFLGEVVVNAALLEAHVTSQEEAPSMQRIDRMIAKRIRRREYRWDALYPKNDQGVGQPQETYEWELMKNWESLGRQFHSEKDIDESVKSKRPWAQQPLSTPQIKPPGDDKTALK